ncbi:MAG: hypothetical protein QE285_21685 [Aquabacterium sp.]|nr:hypothetical protein [Aquabacterium sp.]
MTRLQQLGLVALVAAASLLSACSEKPQTSATKQHDGKPWQGVVTGQAPDAGFKAGDQAAWQEQLRTRTQRGQNEYTRAPATP